MTYDLFKDVEAPHTSWERSLLPWPTARQFDFLRIDPEQAARHRDAVRQVVLDPGVASHWSASPDASLIEMKPWTAPDPAADSDIFVISRPTAQIVDREVRQRLLAQLGPSVVVRSLTRRGDEWVFEVSFSDEVEDDVFDAILEVEDLLNLAGQIRVLPVRAEG